MTKIFKANDHNLRKQISDSITALEATDALIITDPEVVIASPLSVFGLGRVLTAGANITLTPGAGTLTVAASGGGGGITHPQVLARTLGA